MRTTTLIFSLLLFGLMLSAPVTEAGVLGNREELNRLKDQARYYLDKKQPQQAYETLKPTELIYSDDAGYNYLLGVAALDSGRPAEASWAFERVVAAMPQHAGARLDMARAFFQLENYVRAEQELKLLQSLSPPEGAQQAIEFYLAEIERRSGRIARWALSGAVYSELGYSSNATGAPSEATTRAFLYELNPALADILKDFKLESDVEAPDRYLMLGARGDLRYQTPGPWSFYLQPELSRKALSDETDYSSRQLGLTLGSRWKQDQKDVSVFVQWNDIAQDNDNGVTVNRLGLDYGYLLNSRSRVGSQLSFSDNRYSSSDSENSQTATLALYGSYIWGQYRPVVLQGQLSVGQDSADKRPSGDKDLLGLSVSGQYIFNQSHIFFARISHLNSTYSREQFAEMGQRDDRMTTSGLGYIWRYNKALNLKTQFNYTDTASNISLYEMTKEEISTRLTYSF